jgi:hypothetical protein
MRINHWIGVVAVLGTAALVACQPSAKAADAPKPPKASAVSSSRTIDANRQFTIATNATISSRSAKPGDLFTATVVADVQDNAGRVAIAAGSIVSGTVTDVQFVSNPNAAGTLTLDVHSVSVRGRSYPIETTIASLDTQHAARAVNTGDAVKVGAGAAAGAIIGQVVGKNTKGTVIGAVVGAAAGTAYAVATKDSDIRLPAGTHIVVTLTKRLTVSGS